MGNFDTEHMHRYIEATADVHDRAHFTRRNYSRLELTDPHLGCATGILHCTSI